MDISRRATIPASTSPGQAKVQLVRKFISVVNQIFESAPAPVSTPPASTVASEPAPSLKLRRISFTTHFVRRAVGPPLVCFPRAPPPDTSAFAGRDGGPAPYLATWVWRPPADEVHTLFDVDVRIQLEHLHGVLSVTEEWREDKLVLLLKEFFPHGGDHQPIEYFSQPKSRALSHHRTVVWISHPSADLYQTKLRRERELRDYLGTDFPGVLVYLHKRSQ